MGILKKIKVKIWHPIFSWRQKVRQKVWICFLLMGVQGFAGTQKPVQLQLALNWKPEPQFGGFYSILADRLDEKMGMQLRLLEGGSGTPTLQLLTNGKVDAAIVSADEVVVAHDRGNTDVVALFAVYQDNPQMLMYRATPEGGKPPTLADLLQSPRTILSWQSGLPYTLFLKKKYAIQAKQVPHPGGLGVFLSDPQVLAQGFLTSEPILLSQQKPPVPILSFPISKEGFNPYTTVLAVRKSTLNENPELARKWVSLSRLGWAKYLQDPAPSHAWMKKLNPSLEESFLKSSDAAQRKLIETTETKKNVLGFMTSARWNELILQLKQVDLIKKDLKASDLFYPSSGL